MDLQAEKIELMRLLLDTDSQEIITRLKSVFKGEEQGFYTDMPDYVKEDIDIALKEIETGDVYDHEHVMQDFKIKYGVKD